MSEQSEAKNPERCSCCTCGYTWVKGQHGGHSCAQVMEVTIADLRARLAKYEDDQGNPKARPTGAICANDWFLALPPERQTVLREDKWLLADAAFKAGQSLNSSHVDAPTYRAYTTTPGEAVAGIALRQLGDESRWVEIRDLNAHAFPDIGPNDYYPVGTELRLPALSAPSHGEQVRLSEPDFYWVEADEGSWNSPEEWAQDYYDYNGEKPESVSFSCAVELPKREYDSFEFDGNGNCISCRLVAAAPSAVSQEQGE